MRALIQRVKRGSVTIDGQIKSAIGQGLVILLGVGQEDDRAKADQMIQKIVQLRIFEDDQGKMNLSLLDIGGEALVVSQFTLYADTRKGNRPSFIYAGAPDVAKPLVDYFCQGMEARGIKVGTGEFGAYMEVEIINDGPVTIWLEF